MVTQYTTTFGSGIVQRKENITVYITCEWNCPYKLFSTLHLGFKPCYPNSRGFFLTFSQTELSRGVAIRSFAARYCRFAAQFCLRKGRKTSGTRERWCSLTCYSVQCSTFDVRLSTFCGGKFTNTSLPSLQVFFKKKP